MKTIVVVLAALAFAAPTWGQAPEQKPQEPVKPAAAKPGAKDAGKQAVARKHRRWHEDARHCLALPTNTEVIKCAEAYL
jgi:hypothetical protein